jgi:hypothetical protein
MLLRTKHGLVILSLRRIRWGKITSQVRLNLDTNRISTYQILRKLRMTKATWYSIRTHFR